MADMVLRAPRRQRCSTLGLWILDRPVRGRECWRWPLFRRLVLTSRLPSQTRHFRVARNPMAQKGVLRGSHGGDKDFVNALAPGDDVRLWLLEPHTQRRLAHGLKFVHCAECGKFAYLKCVTKLSVHHCRATGQDVDTIAVLASGKPSALTAKSVLWAHEVDIIEAEMAGLSVFEARAAGRLSPTTANSAPAAQFLAAASVPLLELDDPRRVYWRQDESPTDATLAAALDQLVLAKTGVHDDRTSHAFGSTCPTTMFDGRTSSGVVQWMAGQIAQHKPRWLHCQDCGGLGLGESMVLRTI